MANETPTGYGPRHRGLMFKGEENKYELWEVKFMGYMRLRKLSEIIDLRSDARGEWTAIDEANSADAFAELIQCLDDRSLALVMREAKDDGRKALGILREHYLGRSKPRIIGLYHEFCSCFNADVDAMHNDNNMMCSSMLVDCGATSHIVNDESMFLKFDSEFDAEKHVIELADGTRCAGVVKGKGVATMFLTSSDGVQHEIMLSNALYVPSYKQSILSVRAAVKKGVSVNFCPYKSEMTIEGTTFDIQERGIEVVLCE